MAKTILRTALLLGIGLLLPVGGLAQSVAEPSKPFADGAQCRRAVRDSCEQICSRIPPYDANNCVEGKYCRTACLSISCASVDSLSATIRDCRNYCDTACQKEKDVRKRQTCERQCKPTCEARFPISEAALRPFPPVAGKLTPPRADVQPFGGFLWNDGVQAVFDKLRAKPGLSVITLLEGNDASGPEAFPKGGLLAALQTRRTSTSPLADRPLLGVELRFAAAPIDGDCGGYDEPAPIENRLVLAAQSVREGGVPFDVRFEFDMPAGQLFGDAARVLRADDLYVPTVLQRVRLTGAQSARGWDAARCSETLRAIADRYGTDPKIAVSVDNREISGSVGAIVFKARDASGNEIRINAVPNDCRLEYDGSLAASHYSYESLWFWYRAHAKYMASLRHQGRKELELERDKPGF